MNGWRGVRTGFLNRENQQRPRINTGREQDTAAGFTDEGK
jgi:hypothetical protein